MCMSYATPTELTIFVLFMLTYTACEIYTQWNKSHM